MRWNGDVLSGWRVDTLQPEEVGHIPEARARECCVPAAVLYPVYRAVLLHGGHGFAGNNVRLGHFPAGGVNADGYTGCSKGYFK